MPTQYELHKNAPNPFNPSTMISFDLPEPAHVSLKIYGVSGRLVKTLISRGSYNTGRHSLMWDGRDDAGLVVSSGIYFYRLEAKDFQAVEKMTLLK